MDLQGFSAPGHTYGCEIWTLNSFMRVSCDSYGTDFCEELWNIHVPEGTDCPARD